MFWVKKFGILCKSPIIIGKLPVIFKNLLVTPQHVLRKVLFGDPEDFTSEGKLSKIQKVQTLKIIIFDTSL